MAEPVSFPMQDLSKLYYEFTQKQELHDLAGGFHSAGLSDGGFPSPIIIEDLGRHNCVDKLAGGHCSWETTIFRHPSWSSVVASAQKWS